MYRFFVAGVLCGVAPFQCGCFVGVMLSKGIIMISFDLKMDVNDSVE